MFDKFRKKRKDATSSSLPSEPLEKMAGEMGFRAVVVSGEVFRSLNSGDFGEEVFTNAILVSHFLMMFLGSFCQQNCPKLCKTDYFNRMLELLAARFALHYVEIVPRGLGYDWAYQTYLLDFKSKIDIYEQYDDLSPASFLSLADSLPTEGSVLSAIGGAMLQAYGADDREKGWIVLNQELGKALHQLDLPGQAMMLEQNLQA